MCWGGVGIERTCEIGSQCVAASGKRGPCALSLAPCVWCDVDHQEKLWLGGMPLEHDCTRRRGEKHTIIQGYSLALLGQKRRLWMAAALTSPDPGGMTRLVSTAVHRSLERPRHAWCRAKERARGRAA